jgi:hypothetical protein
MQWRAAQVIVHCVARALRATAISGFTHFQVKVRLKLNTTTNCTTQPTRIKYRRIREFDFMSPWLGQMSDSQLLRTAPCFWIELACILCE